jgi:hypothetical protein
MVIIQNAKRGEISPFLYEIVLRGGEGMDVKTSIRPIN